MEQPEAKTEARDSSPSSSPSPQSSRKKHLFSSTENLTAQSCKESGEGGAMSSDKWLSDSPTTDMLKSMSLPPSWPPVANDTGEHPTPSHLETGGEAKETKKQEGKKSSLLSLVTGKKDVARVSEGDSPPATIRKEKETRPKEDGPWPAETLVKRAEKDTTAAVSGKGPSLNPFEEVHSIHSPEMEAGPEPKPEPTPPVPMARTLQTKAVKPRPHPVKPMNSTAAKVTNSSLGTATIISENLINEVMMKKYNPSDPAFAYAQLTHDELIQLVLKQKEAISKKEFQVRELEDYIDNLLVRVMEETPNILRVPAQVGKKAGKM